jgi:hypothetical protein
VNHEANRSGRWPFYEAKGLDNSVLAALWAALDPSADASVLEGEGSLVHKHSKEGPWIFNLPDGFVASLSSLPSQSTLAVAARWVQQPELSHANLHPEDVVPAIEGLRGVAAIAVERKEALLLWMSL